MAEQCRRWKEKKPQGVRALEDAYVGGGFGRGTALDRERRSRGRAMTVVGLEHDRARMRHNKKIEENDYIWI